MAILTTRTELLDLIDRILTEHLGIEKVTRRPDGVVVVAGSSEAFLVQALTVDAPEGADVRTFGEDLVDFIQSGQDSGKASDHLDDPSTVGDGEVFYTSSNGDQWLLVKDTGGRRFVRHVPNRSSGGVVELTDLQSFVDREPHSPQNQALEKVLQG